MALFASFMLLLIIKSSVELIVKKGGRMKTFNTFMAIAMIMDVSLSQSALFAQVEPVVQTGEKSKLEQNFPQFSELPAEIQVQILTTHLQSLKDNPEEFLKELGRIKLISKDINTLLETKEIHSQASDARLKASFTERKKNIREKLKSAQLHTVDQAKELKALLLEKNKDIFDKDADFKSEIRDKIIALPSRSYDPNNLQDKPYADIADRIYEYFDIAG
jgi:hypothetical protein